MASTILQDVKSFLERAQGLSARIEQQESPDEDADGTRPVARSAAKAEAKKR